MRHLMDKNTMPILLTLIAFLFSITTFAKPIHLYDNVAIKELENQIIVYEATYVTNPIRADLPKVPNIGEKLLTVTINDLHAPEEACLDIDATLCTTESVQHNHQCIDTCILTGPEFVTYDEKRKILYVSAATNISGTAGIPQFIFAIDTTNKKINYLNTIIYPYTISQSPDGKHLIFKSEWNDAKQLEV